MLKGGQGTPHMQDDFLSNECQTSISILGSPNILLMLNSWHCVYIFYQTKKISSKKKYARKSMQLGKSPSQ